MELDMITHAKDTAIYNDFQGLKTLKSQVKNQEGGAIDKVAKQFESIFLQMALKSMREANKPLSGELFNSSQSGAYQDMFDKQITLFLSDKGIGFGDMLKKQLSKGHMDKPSEPVTDLSEAQKKALQSSQITPNKIAEPIQSSLADKAFTLQTNKDNNPLKQGASIDNPRMNFVKAIWDQAKKAAQILGVHPAVLIAQAALETSWGNKIIKHADGHTSHNLFNIKAGSSWDKNKVHVKTLEYQDGLVSRQHAAFRSYPSFSESFEDYVNLLKNNSRYAEAVKNADNPRKFLESLQSGGYATDPHYAKKILNILDTDVFQASFQMK
jgi:peptidoglycan hydrolase FlgJ